MRIERAHRHHVADRADLHVDHEQQRDDRQCQRTGPGRQLGGVGVHHLGKTAWQDRDHERAEEALDDPRAPVADDLFAVPLLAGEQEGPEMPGAVARLLHPPVDPEDIGHREDQRGHCGVGQHLHREQIIAIPVPAPEPVEHGDHRPGRPQAGQLGEGDCPRTVCRARFAQHEPGRRAAMDLVDQDRPQHHRHTTGEQAAQRRIRTGQPRMGAGQVERGRDVREGAAERDPAEKPGEADNTYASGDIAAGRL